MNITPINSNISFKGFLAVTKDINDKPSGYINTDNIKEIKKTEGYNGKPASEIITADGVYYLQLHPNLLAENLNKAASVDLNTTEPLPEQINDN